MGDSNRHRRSRQGFRILFGAAAAIVAATACAGTTGLDASFGSGGIALFGPTSGGGFFDAVAAMELQPDGKIVLAGRTSDAGRALAAIGRLQNDGTWDDQFADHGLFVLPLDAPAAPYGSKLDAVGLLSDGRILASGGAYQQVSDYYNSCTVLIELTDSGALDTSFAPDHSGAFCFDFAPPPAPPASYWYRHYDGLRIIDDDTFFLTSTSTNLDRGAVAHLDATGDLVAAYGTNGVAALPTGAYAYLIPSASASAVVAAGVALSSGSVECAGAAVLGVGGVADSGYGTQGRTSFDCGTAYAGPRSAYNDGSGRLLLASNDVDSGDYQPYRFYRFTAAGQLDAAFNPSGQQPGSPGTAALQISGSKMYDSVNAAASLADGHILAIGDAGYLSMGDSSTFNIAILRLNDDASYDTPFGSSAHPGWFSLNIGGLPESSSVATALAFDASGRAYVAISTTDANGKYCHGVMRLIPDRLLDSSFDAAPPLPTCPQ